jgi:Xaa-Pro dipeptidase
MNQTLLNLTEAEKKAAILFQTIEERGIVQAGKSEHELNTAVFNLAFELFGIRKYWHKRIVRAGKNTLFPYRENPPDLILQTDDIVFFDFGPVFEDWEADIGRTYVLGNDAKKIKLKNDIETSWAEGREFYLQNKNTLTGAQLYQFACQSAIRYGWQYGNNHCGHLIGNFPHEEIVGEETINYIHPDNHTLMSDKDKNGNERFWIYEIHFVDNELQIGGFFEQMLF